MLDVFETNAFGLIALTKSINQPKFKPFQAQPYFTEEGIRSTKAAIEIQNGVLKLVQSKPRGGPADGAEHPKRKLVPFIVTHVPLADGVDADEVQNLRAFGSEDQTQPVQDLVDKRLADMRASLEVTIEHMRITAMQGRTVLDADGSTLIDLEAAFGVSPQTASITADPDADKGDALRAQLREIIRSISLKLGAVPVTGFHAFCGPTFFDDLLSDMAVTLTNRMADPRALLQNEAGVNRVTFGGITFEEYRGMADGDPWIAADKAYVHPVGPQLFVTYFAPANYEETVNTVGLPFYARQEARKYNKGRDLEAQTNPLCLCTNPEAIVEVTIAT
jgi:hypothetical protein